MIPVWLFDLAADAIEDLDRLEEILRDWERTPPDLADIALVVFDATEEPQPLDLDRYRELRARGVGEPPFDRWQYSGFWEPTVDAELPARERGAP